MSNYLLLLFLIRLALWSPRSFIGKKYYSIVLREMPSDTEDFELSDNDASLD